MYEPDYETECETCEQKPTVTIVENGEVQHHFGLCGPCCFGEAAALDVDTWNA